MLCSGHNVWRDPRAVDTGVIAGQTVVTEGLHVCYEEAYRG